MKRTGEWNTALSLSPHRLTFCGNFTMGLPPSPTPHYRRLLLLRAYQSVHRFERRRSTGFFPLLPGNNHRRRVQSSNSIDELLQFSSQLLRAAVFFQILIRTSLSLSFVTAAGPEAESSRSKLGVLEYTPKGLTIFLLLVLTLKNKNQTSTYTSYTNFHLIIKTLKSNCVPPLFASGMQRFLFCSTFPPVEPSVTLSPELLTTIPFALNRKKRPQNVEHWGQLLFKAPRLLLTGRLRVISRLLAGGGPWRPLGLGKEKEGGDHQSDGTRRFFVGPATTEGAYTTRAPQQQQQLPERPAIRNKKWNEAWSRWSGSSAGRANPPPPHSFVFFSSRPVHSCTSSAEISLPVWSTHTAHVRADTHEHFLL